MRYILVCLLVASGAVGTKAQVKNPSKKFTLPQQATVSDYQPGKVLVKIKSEYKSLFVGSNSGARSPAPSLGGKIKALAPSGIGKRNTAGRAKALKPTVDISQYFEISFNTSQSVEDFINDLYATGYVELAEPAYTHRMQLIPNDPAASSQYYLTKIKAYEAWNITQGSEDIIIGIVDSGVDIDHPDLASQLYINGAEPINGIDDDGNGYIDDYRGWDFSGDKMANASDPNFVGDNDPSIGKSGPGFTHGTSVGACAGASTNDGVGMAGIGYHSKLLFTKHFADDQEPNSRSYSSELYQGVLYVADMGARVINCSWGSDFKSQIYQDIVNYVTFDLGCLVVGAAGNDGNPSPLYPAAYDNVLSVAGTDSNDKRATFSNYGNAVDISAPGVGIYTALYDNNYGLQDGTSFSAPIVAGAAALVISIHPDFTPLQTAEQLRVTADETMYQQNPDFLGKLGKGRLDIFRALSIISPSIRASNLRLANGQSANQMLLTFDFTNYLATTTSGLEISISTTSSQVTITKNKITPGSIAKGITVTNTLTPFEMTVSPTIPENTQIDIVITYTDGAYHDSQTVTINPNPPYRDIDDNLIKTSISSAGRLGYQDTENSANGNGFIFNGNSMLYEMGVMMGSSSTTILNTIRNAAGNGYDQDFVSLAQIQEIIPGERSTAEIFGEFSNSTVAASQTVKVKYRTLVWTEAPYDKFVIVEYKIKNPTASPLTNFYFGLFADWDINSIGANDAAGWNAETQMGYVYPKQSVSLPQAGIQLLTENPVYYAIDNDHTLAGNPFGLYDGYTDAEKFTTLSTSRTTAGNSTPQGNDVSHVVSAGPLTINADEEITVAFALHAANNNADLITSAKYADSLYNFAFSIPQPVVADAETCYGGSATLYGTGANTYRWYTDPMGGDPLSIDDQLTVSNIVSDTIFYVSNADNSFESLRTPAKVFVRARPVIHSSGPTTFCEGGSITLSVDEASEYMWSTTATTQSIEVTEAGDYSVTIKFISDTLTCQTTSAVKTVITKPNPTALFSAESELVSHTPIQFSDNSLDATAWLWDFGDNSTSAAQNPTHTFTDGGSYTVELTVTAANGCQNTFSDILSIITTAEDDLRKRIQVYPVPVHQTDITVSIDGLNATNLNLTLLNAQGVQLTEASFTEVKQQFSHTIEAKRYPAGMYFLRIQVDNTMVVKKVVISK